MSEYRGRLATHYAQAAVLTKGSIADAIAFVTTRWPNEAGRLIESFEKAAVTAVGRDDVSPPSPAEADFVEFVRQFTLLGRLIGLRRVPGRVRSIAPVAATAAYWTGERGPRPITSMNLSGETLDLLTVTAFIVITQELARSLNPSAETAISRDFVAAIVAAMDSAFIDYANGGIPDVKPASISYGSGAFVSSGGTAANTDSDFKLMLGSLSDAGSTLEYGAWVMAPKAAIYLAGLRDTSGALAYPQVNARGGMLMGLPVLTTAGVPVTGSPPSSTITLLDPSQVLVADDGGGSIQVAESAAVQMSDSPAEGAQHLVSLFQTNSVALKLSRHANWRAARPGMARVLTDFSV